MTATPLKATATALLLMLAASPLARAGSLEDCIGKSDISKPDRYNACTAVIDAKEASGDDLAKAYYRRAMVGSTNPNGDPAAVMADVDKAIELNPKLMEAYAFRALGYFRGQQYDKAIADLDQAIGLAPNRWGLYSLRAMVEAQKKDTKAALADYQKALELGPPDESVQIIRQHIARLQKAAQ